MQPATGPRDLREKQDPLRPWDGSGGSGTRSVGTPEISRQQVCWSALGCGRSSENSPAASTVCSLRSVARTIVFLGIPG